MCEGQDAFEHIVRMLDEVTADVVEHVDPVFFSDARTAAFKALGLN